MKNYLIAARAKIADPANWTQHVLARDANGDDKPSDHPFANYIHWEGIDGRDSQACQWCAVGAVQAVTTEDIEATVILALCKAARQLHKADNIANVNDELGHGAVLACFDRAIGDINESTT
jgi:hypothetical protein